MSHPYCLPTCRTDARRCAQIVNKDLHKAYAELKAILKKDLDAAKAKKQSSGVGWVPVVAVAVVAVGAFYFLRAN
jgi:hypothetical protein